MPYVRRRPGQIERGDVILIDGRHRTVVDSTPMPDQDQHRMVMDGGEVWHWPSPVGLLKEDPEGPYTADDEGHIDLEFSDDQMGDLLFQAQDQCAPEAILVAAKPYVAQVDGSDRPLRLWRLHGGRAREVFWWDWGSQHMKALAKALNL